MSEIKKSDLPFGSEFSPSQIDLAHVLELAEKHSGNWKALEAAIKAKYFAGHKTNDYNQGKLANNTKLGMIAYGILTREGALTDFGKELYALRADKPALYAALAKHILMNLKGLALVKCIQEMMGAGEEVNLTSLRSGLADRGVHYPSGGKHPSMMRLWLAEAGVFVGSRWQIDDARLRAVLGTDPDQFDVLASLTIEQKAFLRALANTGITTPQPANEIVRLAHATYGVKFPEKSLPKLVLTALVDAGYITATKTTDGRGAKPFLVAPTPKLTADVIEPILSQISSKSDPKLIALLKKSLAEVVEEIDSKDKHKAGLALEAMGFKLMRLVDLDYIDTRLRGSATGGAEVDLIFHSTRLVYSRWQIQCKNTAHVSLDDVAKEVGLTHFLKSNAIVIVTTGDAGPEARRYANKIMADSNLAIVMVNGADIKAIIESPAAIVDIFRREAHHAMTLKTLDI